MQTLDERMKDVISPDGGLYCLGWYLGWNPGDKDATLDGTFTAEELRWIAAYMDEHTPPAPTAGQE